MVVTGGFDSGLNVLNEDIWNLLSTMKASSAKAIPSNDKVLAGVRRAVQKVIEQAKRNDEELVISHDGKLVRVKARDL